MADGDLISRASLLEGIAELKESPWYNYGNYEGDFYDMTGQNMIDLLRYSARKEAVETIIDVCIKKEPAVLADSGWISVEERLPDGNELCLICVEGEGICIAYYQPIGDKFSGHEPFWQSSGCRFSFVTHWQPLPEPPKEDNDG